MHGENEKNNKNLVGIMKGNPLGRPSREWKNAFNINLIELKLKYM
jgi:hypothetical protein